MLTMSQEQMTVSYVRTKSKKVLRSVWLVGLLFLTMSLGSAINTGSTQGNGTLFRAKVKAAPVIYAKKDSLMKAKQKIEDSIALVIRQTEDGVKVVKKQQEIIKNENKDSTSNP